MPNSGLFVNKSFQSFLVNDGLLAKVVDAVKQGETKARSTGTVQSFEVFYHGFRQNVVIGRIFVVPAKAADDHETFPLALLYGTLVREIRPEDVADLMTHKIGETEFDEYSNKDFNRIKDELFKGERGYDSLVIFAPAWSNPRDYVAFKYVKDEAALSNLVRHLVFSAYFDPALSSAFNTLMTDASTDKLDVTDITPKFQYPFLTEGGEKQYPQLEEFKTAGKKAKKAFLTKKTADEIQMDELQPEELNVFEALDSALTNATMPTDTEEMADVASTDVTSSSNGAGKGTESTLKDDEGASTGLRRQPDYGESDSYTSQMNEENEKSASKKKADNGWNICAPGGDNNPNSKNREGLNQTLDRCAVDREGEGLQLKINASAKEARPRMTWEERNRRRDQRDKWNRQMRMNRIRVNQGKHINFANNAQLMLWEGECSGQISDGLWENSGPMDHWQAFDGVEVGVGNPGSPDGFRPVRTYQFTRLMEYTGDRMLFLAKAGVAYPSIKPDYTLSHGFSYLGESGPARMQTEDYLKKYAEAILKATGESDLQTVYDKVQAVPYTMRNLKKDLRMISQIVSGKVVSKGDADVETAETPDLPFDDDAVSPEAEAPVEETPAEDPAAALFNDGEDEDDSWLQLSDGGFGAPAPAAPKEAPTTALSRATCANCGGELKTSMAGWIHSNNGSSRCELKNVNSPTAVVKPGSIHQKASLFSEEVDPVKVKNANRVHLAGCRGGLSGADCPPNGTDSRGRCLGKCRECGQHLEATGRDTPYCPDCNTCSSCGCPQVDGFNHYDGCAMAGEDQDFGDVVAAIATPKKDTTRNESPKAAKARQEREAKLARLRGQSVLASGMPKQKKADVPQTFDSIWNELTEDFGPAPVAEVKVPEGHAPKSDGGSSEAPKQDGKPNNWAAPFEKKEKPAEKKEEPKAEPKKEEKKEEKPEGGDDDPKPPSGGKPFEKKEEKEASVVASLGSVTLPSGHNWKEDKGTPDDMRVWTCDCGAIYGVQEGEEPYFEQGNGHGKAQTASKTASAKKAYNLPGEDHKVNCPANGGAECTCGYTNEMIRRRDEATRPKLPPMADRERGHERMREIMNPRPRSIHEGSKKVASETLMDLIEDFADEASNSGITWVSGREQGMHFYPDGRVEGGPNDPHLRGAYENHPQFGNISSDIHQVWALVDDLVNGKAQAEPEVMDLAQQILIAMEGGDDDPDNDSTDDDTVYEDDWQGDPLHNASKKAAVSVRRPTESEMDHAALRVEQALRKSDPEAHIRRRIQSITNPQKLYTYFLALEDENYHNMAEEALNKLKSMGWNMKEAGFTFIPGQVVETFYPELLHEMIPYPNVENHGMPLNPEIVGNGAAGSGVTAYVSTSPAGAMGIGRDGKPQILEGAPLRQEHDIRGPMFTDEFHQQCLAGPARLTMSASKMKKASPNELKAQLTDFLKKVMGEIAASMVAAFKVTSRPIVLEKVPGIGEVQLANIEQPSTVNFNLINTGSRIQYLLSKMNDSDIQDAINEAWAQAAVWHDDAEDGYVYEVFVRAESIDTDTMIMKYKFITGTKGE